MTTTSRSDTPVPRQLSEEERALTPDTAWVVWSNEHNAWWGANQRGYTTSLLAAGLYGEAEAKEIAQPRRSGRPDEEAKSLSTALEEVSLSWGEGRVVGLLLSLLTALSSEREAGFCGATVTLGFGGTLRCGKAAGHPRYVSHYDADRLVTFSDSTTEPAHD